MVRMKGILVRWWMMKGKSETLATIWEVPNDLWEQIHPVILEMDPPRLRDGSGFIRGEF